MDELLRTAAWIGFAGAVGGALNASLSDNLILWPSRISINARTRIVRPGLALNMIIGTVSGVMALYAFTGAGCSSETISIAHVLRTITGALLVGALAASWISNDADKRLLRAAAGCAAAAPAAHPDTVAAMEVATPRVVLETALRLLPQRHRR